MDNLTTTNRKPQKIIFVLYLFVFAVINLILFIYLFITKHPLHNELSKNLSEFKDPGFILVAIIFGILPAFIPAIILYKIRPTKKITIIYKIVLVVLFYILYFGITGFIISPIR